MRNARDTRRRSVKVGLPAALLVLLLAVFAAFRARGATQIDLKTEPADSPAALRLYRRLGMFEVPFDG